MTQCNGCGDCCQRLHLPEGAEVRARELVWRCWAHNREPNVDAMWAVFDLIPAETWPTDDPHRDYFECKNFDTELRTCKVHGTDRKPTCCTGYPWYGKEPTIAVGETLSPHCSFRHDVGLDVIDDVRRKLRV